MPDDKSLPDLTSAVDASPTRSDYSTVQVSLHEVKEDLLAIWRFPGGSVIPPLTVERSDIEDWIGSAKGHEAGHRGVMPGPPGAALPALTLDEIGERIFQRLISPRTQAAWHQEFATDDGRHLRQPVRIEFSIERKEAEAPAEYVQRITRLAAIPVEAMRCPPTILAGVSEQVVLGDKVSVVRRVNPIGPLDTSCLDVKGNLRVLVFAPEPSGPEERLNAEKEVASITGFLAESGMGIEPLVVGKYGTGRATYRRLTALVGDDPPFHVFHFIGHGCVRRGKATVELLFEDEQGNEDWRDVSDIARELLRSQVRLLVLNGCKTAAMSALAAQFPAVVGMQFEVSDEAAQLFALGFYRQLAETGQLDDAVWSGRRNVLTGSSRAREDYRHPVLYMQSEDGLLLRIPPRIIRETLPVGRLDIPYCAQLTVRGGRGPHGWTAQNLHDGLILDAREGRIHGVPREAGKRNVAISACSHDGLLCDVRLPLEIQAKTGDPVGPSILTEEIG